MGSPQGQSASLGASQQPAPEDPSFPASSGGGVAGELRGSLAECLPGGAPDSSCVERVFAVAKESDLEDLVASSATLAENAASVCLIPARDFVERAWKGQRGKALDLLGWIDPSVCQGGFTYGALAAAGAYEGEAARAAVEECAVFGNEARQWCSHGVGLISWREQQDLVPASRVCSELAEPSQRMQCSVGVIMGSYEWPAAGSPRPEVSAAYQELPGLCASWPQDAEGMAEGCGRGVGYVLFIPIASAMDASAMDASAMDSAAGAATLAAASSDLAQLAARGCSEVSHPAASAECFAALVEYTASRAEWNVEKLGVALDAVCAAVPAASRARCP